jgi:hypothetical protein
LEILPDFREKAEIRPELNKKAGVRFQNVALALAGKPRPFGRLE